MSVVRMAVTAGGRWRVRLLLLAVLVTLWALSGPLAAVACLLGGCDDGCDPAMCHHRAAQAGGATSDSIDAAGCTCSVHSRSVPPAVTPTASGALSQLAGSWLAAALPSAAPLSAPRPRLPHPEVRLCKLHSVVRAASGWRAPPSA